MLSEQLLKLNKEVNLQELKRGVENIWREMRKNKTKEMKEERKNCRQVLPARIRKNIMKRGKKWKKVRRESR